MMTRHQLGTLFFFTWGMVSALAQNLLSCDSNSKSAVSGYFCNGFPSNCDTFVILRTNPWYWSLSNLSSYLGINRFMLAQANGFSADTEFLPQHRPLLIPIECQCNSGNFEAVVTKTTIKGESFYGITESLEGLTTCKSIREKNPSVSPWNLKDKIQLVIPLRCACPNSSELNLNIKLLISYPVSGGDTISNLALRFNITPESIIFANRKSLGSFKPENLLPVSTTLLIPLKEKPVFGPDWGSRNTSISVAKPRKKRSRMMKIWIYVVVSAVVLGIVIAIAAALLVIRLKKKNQNKEIPSDMEDLELQKLSLSIRTTSQKKVSFGQVSQGTLDGQIIDIIPSKISVVGYTIDELRKATEDFNSSNHIDKSVFHGRLNGENLAVKRVKAETLSKIDLGLFHAATHHHPNIIRLMGTCSTDGADSYLVFEYAKNGSLKDWLHGGLAMKSQFIASCYCFLNWKQRLRICLDVATALQYMHQIMIPSYIHSHIKSQIIFLDEEFNAKVGNFGIPRCSEDEKEEQPFWSKGYLAPELLQQSISSAGTDIFAYGVVLLEVLSGKKPITRGDEEGEGDVWLSEKIKSVLQSENAEELRGWMDSILGESYSFDEAVTLANLARACVESDPGLRPSAGEIVEKLSKLVQELPEGDEFSSICESSSRPLVKSA